MFAALGSKDTSSAALKPCYTGPCHEFIIQRHPTCKLSRLGFDLAEDPGMVSTILEKVLEAGTEPAIVPGFQGLTMCASVPEPNNHSCGITS